MKTQDITLTDADDGQAIKRWETDHARLLSDLIAVQARADSLQKAIDRHPATTALNDAKVAEESAHDAYRHQTEDVYGPLAAAARTAAGDVDTKQTLLDNAIRNVGDELATLLKEATTSTSVTATVDGLALRARYRAAIDRPTPLWNAATIPFRNDPNPEQQDPQIVLPIANPQANDPDFARVLDVLARLDESVDAVTDLITAEAVHQLVNGNAGRSGAALDIAATGTVPDRFDVIRTPSTGHDITHRIVVLMDPTRTWSPPDGAAASIASTADPVLAGWVSAMLPDLREVRMAAQAVDPDTGQATAPLILTAADVTTDPLLWLRLATDPGELTGRVSHLARQRWQATTTAATGRIQVADPPPPDPPLPAVPPLVLSDLTGAAAAVARLLGSARALTPADLIPPATQPPPSAGPQDLIHSIVTRVTTAEAAVRSIHDLLAAPDTTRDEFEIALLDAAAIGIAEATPSDAAAPPDIDALHNQAAAAAARLVTRIDPQPFSGTPDSADDTLRRARARLADLTGGTAFLLTPIDPSVEPLSPRNLSPEDQRITGADPIPLRQWLHDHATVRPTLAALLDAYNISETLDGSSTLTPIAAQRPPADNDAWVGTDPIPREGLLHLIAIPTYSGPVPDQITGLAVDAWVQTVPNPSRTTGLAFHYDQPSAGAPPAVLLAVHPNPGAAPATWDLDTLIDVVTSTMTMAADRAVTPDQLPDAARITLDIKG